MRLMSCTTLLKDSSMHFCTSEKNSLYTCRASSTVYASRAPPSATVTPSKRKATKGRGMLVGSMWWS